MTITVPTEPHDNIPGRTMTTPGNTHSNYFNYPAICANLWPRFGHKNSGRFLIRVSDRRLPGHCIFLTRTDSYVVTLQNLDLSHLADSILMVGTVHFLDLFNTNILYLSIRRPSNPAQFARYIRQYNKAVAGHQHLLPIPPKATKTRKTFSKKFLTKGYLSFILP